MHLLLASQMREYFWAQKSKKVWKRRVYLVYSHRSCGEDLNIILILSYTAVRFDERKQRNCNKAADRLPEVCHKPVALSFDKFFPFEMPRFPSEYADRCRAEYGTNFTLRVQPNYPTNKLRVLKHMRVTSTDDLSRNLIQICVHRHLVIVYHGDAFLAGCHVSLVSHRWNG